MLKSSSFLRAYVVPTLLLFALPALALWFFGHAERVYNDELRDTVLANIAADQEISTEERAEARAYYESHSFSEVCGNPGEGEAPEFCSDYSQFAAFELTAIAALALGVFSLIFILGCAGLSFLSRPFQWLSFVVGWNFLRFSTSIQVALQGTLAVALSFWMTAVWFDRYYIKLILVAAFVACAGVFLAIKAIFSRTDSPFQVEGELISEASAPELWRHVREVCMRLGTEAPTQIIGGIDDNFFVVEGEVYVAGGRISGRTLFVSLALLRNLSRGQADAVLAHEMAHFSGGDTAFSNKLAPSLVRYSHYLAALHEAGPVAWPAMQLMKLYRALFQLSLSKSSREREFRADRIAAEQTSPENVAGALVTIGAYSRYRGLVEDSLFERNDIGGDLDISTRIVVGFSDYAKARGHTEIQEAPIPHPFDSHPPLHLRASAVGLKFETTDHQRLLLEKPAETWFQSISGAEDIEQRLWAAYESRFAQVHERSLAYRYLPANEQETALVTKYFPLQSFAGVKDGPLQLSYFGLRLHASDEVISFEHVRDASTAERMFKKYLDLKLDKAAAGRGKTSVCLSGIQSGEDVFVQAFGDYWARHRAMKAYQSQRASEAS